MSQPLDMSLADVTTTTLTGMHSQEVMKKFKWALKRVANEHGSNEDETLLTQEELIQLIRTWEPQRDIICLYVRKDISRERLNKEFLGLSVTLSLLQEQVTVSPSILGKTQMRQSGPRHAQAIDIPIDCHNKQHASVVTHPNVEFHTQSSLLNQIWISINHCWLVLYVTEHLFREVKVPWSYGDALVHTFQMMAPCGPGRYEFLSPLVGYCLRFRTPESIDAKRTKLREIWKDPSLFLSNGNSFLMQFTSEAQSRIILACFQDLASNFEHTCNQISYNRNCSLVRRWTILRSYIFHFWLDSVTNSNIKAIVINGKCQDSGTNKKRKIDACQPTEQVACSNRLSTTLTIPITVQKRTSDGLQSIISSLRTSNRIPPRTFHDIPSVTDDVDGKTINHHHNPHPSYVSEPSTTLTKDMNWTSLRLVTLDELKRFVRSYLLIHRRDGVDVISELSPLEVYSADKLHDLSHCRISGNASFSPTLSGKVNKKATFHIHAEAEDFLDMFAKSFHVARVESDYFKEHGQNLPLINQIQSLCKAIVQHGNIDRKRAIGQYRVNIGNAGQNWVDGAPCQLHGLQFKESLEKDKNFDAAEVLNSIGQLAEFTWRVTCALQNDACDHPIAPDPVRKQLYAAHLNQYLNMDGEVGFEDLTLVVSSLYPTINQVSEHKDTMNDTLAGYTRTAAFNMVMIDSNDDSPTILHLQVICNFRKVIGHYLTPFLKYIAPVAIHARQYLEKWHRSIQSVYAGKTENMPTAYDRSAFFLDDILDWTAISISEEGKHKLSISSDYILTEINTSRTLSLSMFIDPIVKLQRFLKFDQTIELAFACSFLSNPFWFDWTMHTMTQRLVDPNDSYQLGLHPFYDWSQNTIAIFGSWQGGPYNRWSPCGGNKESVLETFGAQPDATPQERERGEKRLSQVVSILHEHIEWVNSLSTLGNLPVIDMPLHEMKKRCQHTVQEIAKVASCQFSHFRLGILTTILSGCGLLEQGKHLRNLMYPVKGSASFKHLCCPISDSMSHERARALGDNNTFAVVSNDGEGVVQEDHHDLFMQHLSAELGFKIYVRDEIECILCESHPMRSLNCRDWFRKGMTLYDCNENGEFFYREYGRDTTWVKLIPPQEYEFAYIGKSLIHYISFDVWLSYCAAEFGKELRSDRLKTKIKFKGRNSRNSQHQRTYSNNYHTKEPFSHPSMQIADFYIGSELSRQKLRSMFVLGDAEHAIETSLCNNLKQYPWGIRLHKYLHSLLTKSSHQPSSIMGAGSYHMDSELNNSEVTFFPGHLDKPFVHTAWFVPLGDPPFFTVVSVSRFTNLVQDTDSMQHFQDWKSALSSKEARKVDQFLREFDIQVQKHTGVNSPVHLIFLSKRGSVLSFAANICYHATINTGKPPGFPRDMFIFHPLDGLS